MRPIAWASQSDPTKHPTNLIWVLCLAFTSDCYLQSFVINLEMNQDMPIMDANGAREDSRNRTTEKAVFKFEFSSSSSFSKTIWSCQFLIIYESSNLNKPFGSNGPWHKHLCEVGHHWSNLKCKLIVKKKQMDVELTIVVLARLQNMETRKLYWESI